MLYFTGSDYFNRSMRLYAKKLGYTLSDHGIAPASNLKGTKGMVSGSNTFPAETENDVFRILGIDFKPPSDREV